MKLTKKQLTEAHNMEAQAIGLAGEFINQFAQDTADMMLFMLTLKIIQDEYPNLYPNVANAPQIITEWLALPKKQLPLHPMFIQRSEGKRLLNFPEHNKTKH